MASGQAIARASRAKAQVKASSNNTTDKWVGKKHKVEPGDLVRFHTPNAHMFGGMGTVIGYLDKNVVLLQTFGGLDSDYPPQVVQVRNQKANENYSGRDFQAHYQNYIQEVVFRTKGSKPKKKRPPVKFYEVTSETLPGVLAGTHEVPDGHKVVLLPEGRTPELTIEERVDLAVKQALSKIVTPTEEETHDESPAPAPH